MRRKVWWWLSLDQLWTREGEASASVPSATRGRLGSLRMVRQSSSSRTMLAGSAQAFPFYGSKIFTILCETPPPCVWWFEAKEPVPALLLGTCICLDAPVVVDCACSMP